jgi:integrase/recombinase XerC
MFPVDSMKGSNEKVVAKGMRVSDRFSPHKIRHSAITALLDLTDGNFRSAQALSRHKSMDILKVYDDNRHKLQGF